MTWMWDRDNRRFLGFLGACWLLLAGFLLAAGLAGQKETGEAVRKREAQISSWLLEQGEPASQVALALKNQKITAEGRQLLETAGRRTDSHWTAGIPEADNRSAWGFLLAGYLCCGLLAGAGTLWAMEKREKLYREAISVIEEYSRGNLEKHLTRNSPGGIYRLFTAVDQLALALRASGEKESRAREFLKQSVSDISHQLKTPLAALSMYTEIILEEASCPEVVKKFASSSAASLERIQRLTFMMLRLTRLDAGEILFQRRLCPVGELVEEAVRDLKIRAEKEGKRLVTEGNPLDTLVCDPEWTGEAVGNLIKNALDHTCFGGTIRICWKRSPIMIRLQVEDDGEGIAPEDIHHIFKRFYRSRRSEGTARDRQGVGLGLPLAKAIVDGQGGVLSVQSQPGQGACFSISFPAPESLQIRKTEFTGL